MSKRHSEDNYKDTIKKQKVHDKQNEGEEDHESECCHSESSGTDDSTESEDLDADISDYFKSINESLFEKISTAALRLLSMRSLFSLYSTSSLGMT